MIGMILVLISWLVFILSGLGNGLSHLVLQRLKIWMRIMWSLKKALDIRCCGQLYQRI